MKINITKKEYSLLIDMLCIANWVMHAVNEYQHSSEHELFIKKMMSFCNEMDANDKIMFSEEMDDYFETGEYVKYIQEKFIKPYKDDFFVEELIERLAKRDLIAEVGEKQLMSMDFVEKMTRLEAIKDLYQNEFSGNGLKYLKINRQAELEGNSRLCIH
jgi:hypothetical protein